MATIPLDAARRRWSAAQGLDGARDEPLEQTLVRTGWLRTLGGTAAYVALGARSTRATVDAVRSALAAGRLRVAPAARGCMYLVPEAHAGLARRLAARLSRRRVARELERAGTDEAELARVGAAVLEALTDGPRSTAELKKALPDGVIRGLGDAGKKVGSTSTLPPALRALEFEGRVIRKPVDDRLDHERYDWVLAPEAPQEEGEEEDLATLARCFFTWAGPTTRDAFAAWTGLSKGDAKAGMAAIDLAEVEVEGSGVAYAPPDAPPGEAGASVHLGGMDNLFALRRDAAALVDPAHAAVEIHHFGRSVRRLDEMSQPLERTIVQDGRIVGLWAFDPETSTLARHWFDAAAADAARDGAEEARVRAVFEALGTTRVFSLDSEALMAKRAARIAKM